MMQEIYSNFQAERVKLVCEDRKLYFHAVYYRLVASMKLCFRNNIIIKETSEVLGFSPFFSPKRPNVLVWLKYAVSSVHMREFFLNPSQTNLKFSSVSRYSDRSIWLSLCGQQKLPTKEAFNLKGSHSMRKFKTLGLCHFSNTQTVFFSKDFFRFRLNLKLCTDSIKNWSCQVFNEA